ncbi:potassium channel subfamily K member 5 isoform X1 [Hippocampus comes]|uniref:potassium channel subfamily K member 5 isoform X1 n=1 Tax=Hippocampus comes TaxID=109280 RepID=UPI00094E74E7|nr:PREDICTED: potassium channel subfamily K member 5-like isoform X1 [Hippocampus comes]XP_019718963.1 PREDICTED: potassium channel subfamily K member 5-like isoform X1 [Hippocampus comes]
MRCTTVLALLFGVVLYLGMGALVFQNLEASEEYDKFQELLAAKNNFLNNHFCVSEPEFSELVKGVASAVEAGLEVDSLSTNFTTRWDVASAFFFCGAIITTIGTLNPFRDNTYYSGQLIKGFGNLSPRTWYGQLFCVCYALVGIPMFGILLAGVGDHMGTVLRRAVAKIETLFLKRQVRPTTVRVISAVLSILIGCLIFLAVPTVFFQKSEGWSFLESLYFVVITLTTVGFGDYVPDGSQAGGLFFKPLVWLWIVFGLAYFASILTMIGNWLRVLSKRTRAEMEELRAHATDWTQNMSKDFRIPNPLEFNDPFLLQRRRWKRSERRRIRRGAQVTLGYWARGGPENGHLPGHWAGLSSSMSRLEGRGSSLERTMRTKPMGRLPVGGGTMPRAKPPELSVALRQQMAHHSLPHLLTRSFSLPAAPSASELDSPEAAVLDGSPSGSDFDSRSDISSSSSSFSDLRKLRAHRTVEAEGDKMNPEEEARCGENKASPDLSSLPPSPSLPPYSTGLLDFFGENLAYIDESSDALSERADEKRRRPHKPKRKSVKNVRRLSKHEWSSKQARRPGEDLQPPSNPPTPPPDSLLSSSLTYRDSPQTL